MKRLAVLFLPILIGIFAAPASAGTVLSTKVVRAKAVDRTCHARLASGKPGVVTRGVRAPDTGWISGRLSARRGDWDLAIFDRRTGRLVAASAYRRTRELADGLVVAGQALRVQACRRSGKSRRARLRVESVAVEAGAAKSVLSLARVSTPTPERKRQLVGLGLDLTEHGGEKFVEVVLHGAQDAVKLRKHNFVFTIEVADLVAQSERFRRADRRFARSVKATSLPSGRKTYRRLHDYSAELKALAANDKEDIVNPVTLPYLTWEGRPVEGIEITEGAGSAAADGRPVFVQMGLHHSREWPSGEHALEWAHELVNGYRRGDTRATELVRATRTIVVPVVNPDGFNISREAGQLLLAGDGRGTYGPLHPDDGETVNFFTIPYEYQRKNCRAVAMTESHDPSMPRTPGSCFQPGTGLVQFGVDPNRNYGGFWGGPGTSRVPATQTYPGPGPFSEPETQNIEWLLSHNQVTALITNHTFSNLVLRPPGTAAQGVTPDEPAYKELGDSMAAENGYKSQFGYQLYDTTGTTEDWSYWSTGGFGFTFEIGPHHFHPPFADTVAEWTGDTAAAGGGGGNHEAYYKVQEAAANPALHSVIAGKAPAGAEMTLAKSFETPTFNGTMYEDALETKLRVPESGSFEWHANPSTRPIVALDPGREAVAAPSPEVTYSGAAGTGTGDADSRARPCANFNTTNPACFNEHPLTVPGPPEADNYSMTVTLGSPSAPFGGDWDFKVFRDTDGDGTSFKTDESGQTVQEEQVGQSGNAEPWESTTISEPILTPGEYVIRVINYVAVGPYDGKVTFAGPPEPQTSGVEAWTLTCEHDGNPVYSIPVVVGRGERVEVERCKAPRTKGGKGKGPKSR